MNASELGRIRRLGHEQCRNQRPGLKGDSGAREDIIGAAGECEFSRLSGIPVETKSLRGGDGGIDFKTHIGTVDVKTFVKPNNLLVLPKDIPHLADFIVLARFNVDTETATLLGYATAADVRASSIRSFGYGPSHFIPVAALQTMARFWKLFRANKPVITSGFVAQCLTHGTYDAEGNCPGCYPDQERT